MGNGLTDGIAYEGTGTGGGKGFDKPCKLPPACKYVISRCTRSCHPASTIGRVSKVDCVVGIAILISYNACFRRCVNDAPTPCPNATASDKNLKTGGTSGVGAVGNPSIRCLEGISLLSSSLIMDDDVNISPLE